MLTGPDKQYLVTLLLELLCYPDFLPKTKANDFQLLNKITMIITQLLLDRYPFQGEESVYFNFIVKYLSIAEWSRM